ncbi:Hypothetical predicted protein [Olea europaea subsp. europaea]|uniref:Uncharacterized protein n=1 Tax=Olea europaea subsp. europaea TaxID=158383 RepID=A0A8S0TNE7_OLEEU|nr:Hypothetical predicted protein [Olea europaea subsp. europaea]
MANIKRWHIDQSFKELENIYMDPDDKVVNHLDEIEIWFNYLKRVEKIDILMRSLGRVPYWYKVAYNIIEGKNITYDKASFLLRKRWLDEQRAAQRQSAASSSSKDN